MSITYLLLLGIRQYCFLASKGAINSLKGNGAWSLSHVLLKTGHVILIPNIYFLIYIYYYY